MLRLLSTLLMLAGAVLLLYTGATFLQAEYYRHAARGDSALPLPPHLAGTSRGSEALQPRHAGIAHAFDSNPSHFVVSRVRALPRPSPTTPPASPDSTISRIVIPAIALDSKVTEVGWVMEEEAEEGGAQPVWEVARYMAGHHRGSATPGEGGNIVLSGHVGGYGRVFGDLFYLKPGNEVLLYSQGKTYPYVVSERLILEEEHASPEQRAANARYIAPTSEEVVTLVTCWPPTGANKFTQRIIIRAHPHSPHGIPYTNPDF